MDSDDRKEIDVRIGDDKSVDDDRIASRPWLGIHFDCCGVYSRIYRNADQSHYDGFCPRCLRPLRVPIGSRGTTQRIFRAT